MPRWFVRALLALAWASVVYACAAKQPSAQGVAVYLTADPVSGAQMKQADLAKLKLEDQPVIAQADILSYTAGSHEMKLSEAAVQRLIALKVPMNGRGFVVTVDGLPVYGGAFWSYLSSLMYDGVTIMLPMLSDESTVRIGSAYPSADQPPVNDPRTDPRVMEALHKSGVLKE